MYELLSHRQQQLRAFAAEVFVELPRADQRRWAGTYLEGLLSTPGKKTLRRMTDALGASPSASQSLHQFVNGSPWDWGPVRDQLARWTARHGAPDSLVIDMAYLPKRGSQSCGVHTRYIPGQGIGSCQLGVVATLAGRGHISPVDWSLHLPRTWIEDEAGRARTRVPLSVGARTTGQQALDLVDAQDHALTSALPVVADLADAEEVTSLVMGLTLRNRDFVIAVPATALVQTERGATLPAGRLWGPVRRTRSESVDDWRTPTMATAAVRLPLSQVTSPELQLMTVRPPGEGRMPQLWLSNIRDRRRMFLLAGRLDDSARLIERLTADFGLADFEGRSYPGWHHYVTLVSAACAWSQFSHEPAAPEPPSDSGH
ncbi:transposase [Streptomyces sp. 130]|uniref:IS701 family transposase n=1 Tax=Streptomyces sp. 130 TaxID=2591006 RepID=UPI001180896A|nr:transposase [Streptomyces sp. 130]TRV75599.1 transposase [Streptomyces sp. 130]